MRNARLMPIAAALCLLSAGAMAAPVTQTATPAVAGSAIRAAGAPPAKATAATRCRDDKGRYQACAPKVAAKASCRDANGRFASCKK